MKFKKNWNPDNLSVDVSVQEMPCSSKGAPVILPDDDERGAPEVSNGLCLCRLHHGAFDTDLLGIRPDG
ncbi:MAG TPA: HNH endonuclease, partial [Candidatus Ozemobacteraceae bacterium]|nr:HNH endonuclease [Candidatus Ozemobacteraceae bacterium]